MSEEKKKLTQEEAKEKLKLLNKTINNFVDAISDKVNSIKELLPEEANLEQLMQPGIGENLDFLFIYDFARETRIGELVNITGKTVETIIKEYEQQLKGYCGLFVYRAVKELKKEEYGGLSFSQLLVEDAEVDENSFAEVKIKPGTRLEKLVKTVTSATQEAITEQVEILGVNQNAKIKPENFEIPVSKLHNTIFESLLNEKGQIPGQISFASAKVFENGEDEEKLVSLNVGRPQDTNKLVLYAIDQDELNDFSISREIDSYDQRVYDAICTLYDCGNRIISFRQIHFTMGYTTEPSADNYKKLNESILRLSSTKIYIDETRDYKDYLPKDVQLKRRGRILNVTFRDVIVNGKVIETAISILEEPCLLEFSRRRKQIETIPRCVIEIKGQKTRKSLAIENYLLTRISRMKSAKRNNTQTSNKIRFDSIIEKANEKNKPQRVIDKTISFLEHYKATAWIKDYKNVKDGVEIIL